MAVAFFVWLLPGNIFDRFGGPFSGADSVARFGRGIRVARVFRPTHAPLWWNEWDVSGHVRRLHVCPNGQRLEEDRASRLNPV